MFVLLQPTLLCQLNCAVSPCCRDTKFDMKYHLDLKLTFKIYVKSLSLLIVSRNVLITIINVNPIAHYTMTRPIT